MFFINNHCGSNPKSISGPVDDPFPMYDPVLTTSSSPDFPKICASVSSKTLWLVNTDGELFAVIVAGVTVDAVGVDPLQHKSLTLLLLAHGHVYWIYVYIILYICAYDIHQRQLNNFFLN